MCFIHEVHEIVNEEFEITEEGADLLNDLSTYFYGILFLLILGSVMLLIHIALDFFFHVLN